GARSELLPLQNKAQLENVKGFFEDARRTGTIGAGGSKRSPRRRTSTWRNSRACPDRKEERMHTRFQWDGTGFYSIPRRRHAVVVGGSLAGMLAARVLSDHFTRVTLLERDQFSVTPLARKGLPQGRHVHALLERGRLAMERLFPGLDGELA